MISHAAPAPAPLPTSARATWPAWGVVTAACGYVVIAPNVGIYYSEFQSFDVWRGLQVALLVAIAAAFVAVPAVRRMVMPVLLELPARARRALAVVALLGAVSAVISARPWYALRELALMSLLFVTALSVAGAVRCLGPRFHRTMSGALVVMALFYVTIFLAVLEADPWGQRAWALNPFVGFVTPRFFGQLATWTLPLIVLPLLDAGATRSVLTRAAMWAAPAGWWMLFLLSGSRAPVIAFVLATMLAVACYGRRMLPWLRVHALSLAGGVAGYVLIPGVRGNLQIGVSSALGRGADGSGREILWRHALALMERSPWLGVGPGNFAYFRVPVPRPSGEIAAHPHNALLQAGAEWGVPAALILVGVLAWALVAWVRARRADERRDGIEHHASLALTVALCAALVQSCLDGMAVLPLPQTLGALAMGWALGIHLRGRREAQPARHTSVSALLAQVGAAAAAVGLIATLRLPAAELRQDEPYNPGFWVHGAIP